MTKGVEEEIRRAIESGQFDNLPGKGKPLHLDDSPYEEPEWRMAHLMLNSGGFTLPWIEKLREIDTSIDSARLATNRAWEWRQEASRKGQPAEYITAEWQRAQAVFQAQVDAINHKIASVNLEVPLERFQRALLNYQTELENITGQ